MHAIDNADGGLPRLPETDRDAAALESATGAAQRLIPPTAEGAVAPVRSEGRPVDPTRTGGEPLRPGPSLSAGRLLRERYLIESCLGVGGKGTVYRARDRFRDSLPEPEQHVALKVLHASRDALDQTMERMREELHCGQALSHVNIVNVYELDRDDDVIFYTMELLDGELLSAVLAKHRPAPLDRAQALQMIRQIGAGLQHAHERGVVHGDLKPANIMVTRGGELRILDFGSSKRFLPGQSTTATGRSSATLAYASCEQLEGRPADPRDDLYAFACICFELLAGSHPFDRRPASLVRDFGVTPKRPAGLSGRQWRALQKGLSWSRAGRSMSVPTFVQGVSGERDAESRHTRLDELKSWTPRRPTWHARAPVLAMVVMLAVGVCVTQWGASTATVAPASPLARPQSAMAAVSDADAVPAAAERAWAMADQNPDAAAEPSPAVRPTARRLALTIAVEGYHVGAADRFVEIRVGRNMLGKNASFTWWTEAASAHQGVDYVAQGKAIQTFGSARRSTRLYVKLVPQSQRAQRDFFYLAIAQPGSKHPDAVSRTQIWLPIPRGPLQASR